LEIDDCGFTLISSGDINTTIIDHSSTTNVAQQWALLAKQWEFTKTISHITIISASFAPSNTSSFEINSNSQQPKQLKW
jgi:hypothetical protein